MKLAVWDGESDVSGVAAAVLRENYAPPEGGVLVLVYDDEDNLTGLQNIWPGRAGLVPITREDVDSGAVLAALEAPAPVDGGDGGAPAPTVSPEEVAQLRSDLDWLIGYVVTGEV